MQLMKRATAAALALASALAFNLGHAADQGTVAIVNGLPIPQARMDYVVKAQVQQGQKDDEALRKNVKDALIMREVLTQDAIKKGLDKTPEYQTQLDMAKQEFLIRAYFDEYLKNNPLSDEETKAEYERIKKEQTGNGERKEYKARHILIKDEKKAKAALAEITKTKGKSFAAVAKAKSEDGGSKAQGGALEWSDGSNFVKEFGEAMTKLKKGEYTKSLIKTQYGYHIIMMDDVRDMQFPELDQIKDKLQQQLLGQKRDKLIADLRAAAKIE